MRPLQFLAPLLLVTASLAAEECAHVVLAPQNANWTQPVVVPRFDPLAGTLTGVRIELGTSIVGASHIEHLGGYPADYTLQFQAFFELRRPDASNLITAQPSQSQVVSLTAFDGIFDFGGTSGATLPSSAATVPPARVLLTDPSDLALFTGTPGSAGTVMLSARASDWSGAYGPGNPAVLFVIAAAADVRVCFEFTPRVQPFCSGDGSGSACPCGNDAATGTVGGCLNSLGQSGVLAATGAASLGNDTFALEVNSLPASAPALFFQGTSATNGGAGTAFGDGLRCVGGAIVRLGTRSSNGGSAQFPSPGGASISQVGGIATAGSRTYQVWYRNSASFCTAAAFNLTNGLRVTWLP